MKKITWLLLLLSCSTMASSQSGIADDLRDEFGPYSVRYVSESIIRAVINYVDSAGTITQIGDDLEKVIYYSDEEEHPQKWLDDLKEKVISGGFEEMVTVKNSETDAVLFSKEDDGVASAVVVLLVTPEKFTYLEILGEINLSYFVGLFLRSKDGDGFNLGKELGGITDMLNLNVGF